MEAAAGLDDGCGFSLAFSKSKLGLKSIPTRSEATLPSAKKSFMDGRYAAEARGLTPDGWAEGAAALCLPTQRMQAVIATSVTT